MAQQIAKLVTHQMAVDRLRRLQGKRTLREFAAALGVSHQYIADIYHGRRGMGEAVLKQLRLTKNPPAEPTYSEIQRNETHRNEAQK